MNRLGLSNFVPFLILVSCHVSLVGQSQHTISIDPISLSSSIVQLEYENNFEAQQSFFVRAHYDMDNIHSTGVQIGIDTTGGFIDDYRSSNSKVSTFFLWSVVQESTEIGLSLSFPTPLR